MAGNSECDVRADCVNTAGSYNCTCKTGFSGNGSTCEGITRACDLKEWVQRKILFLIKRSKILCWIEKMNDAEKLALRKKLAITTPA